jgi:hypothetical protein
MLVRDEENHQSLSLAGTEFLFTTAVKHGDKRHLELCFKPYMLARVHVASETLLYCKNKNINREKAWV